MWFPVVVWMAVTAVSTEPLYMKIGDTAVLTPNSVVNPITSIVWKLGPNIAMVWNGGKIVSYQQFKDRGTLNISTGVMIITGLTRNHSGTYTAEINFKIIDKTELLVISAVPQPNLYVLCDPEMTYCVFTCDGSTTDAEPVEYGWTAGDERWTSTNQHRITKEEKEWWFSCTLENPVGSSSSEKVHNPFMKTDWRVMFILTAVILVVCIIIFCFRHKCRKAALHLLNCGGCLDLKKISMIDTSSSSSGFSNNIAHQENTYNEPSSIMKGGFYDCNSFKPQWQFQRSSEEWRDYRKRIGCLNECSLNSDDIERLYQEKPQDTIPFTVKEVHYQLDLKERIQTNLKTNTKRNIRRVLVELEW